MTQSAGQRGERLVLAGGLRSKPTREKHKFMPIPYPFYAEIARRLGISTPRVSKIIAETKSKLT